MLLYISLSAVMMLIVIASLFGKAVPADVIDSDRPRRVGWSYPALASMAFMALLFVLTGWRSINIGNDTFNYVMYFNHYALGEFDFGGMEIGYKLYCMFIGLFTKDPHAFLIITAAISYIAIGVYIRRNSVDMTASVCLFFAIFFSVYTNTLRQALAMIIVLYAYGALKRRRYIRATVRLEKES